MMALAQRLSRVPLSKVELSISCRDLLNKDVSSKSDPCAVLFYKAGSGWQELGRTENIQNTLNPDFARSFEMDYFFEEVQQMMVSVYDIDNNTPKLSDDDFLGSLEFTLGQVVSQSPYTKPLVVKGGKPAGKGKITIRSEEVAKVNDVLHLTFSAQKLDKKDTFGKSDPFLEFSRQTPDGAWQLVHRTEVVKNDLSPKWKTFQIKAQKLTGGNYEAPIKVDCYDHDADGDSDLIGSFQTSVPQLMTVVDQVACYDYDSDGSHDLIGIFNTSVMQMQEGAKNKGMQWPCINPKKQSKKKYKDSGTVFLNDLKITKDYSFLDFVFGGMEIHFTVGVDFTASNGDPRTPKSLHYLNPHQPNEYQRAIQAVGTVIQDYDSDQMFPALGFGAKIPPNMDISHEFAINFNVANPFCQGIAGVQQAYVNCVPQIQLYGPTNFTPMINHVMQFAAAAQREGIAKNYFVLLIITDGVITDIRETIGAIVYASGLPMSIIIVGVGCADFTAMDILDGDGGLLKDARGTVARRDIVQFVPFRDFQNVSPAELAKHVLAEVPRQVTDYYRLVNLGPAQRLQGQGGMAALTQQMQNM